VEWTIQGPGRDVPKMGRREEKSSQSRIFTIVLLLYRTWRYTWDDCVLTSGRIHTGRLTFLPIDCTESMGDVGVCGICGFCGCRPIMLVAFRHPS
jgi:hypothetical protein